MSHTACLILGLVHPSSSTRDTRYLVPNLPAADSTPSHRVASQWDGIAGTDVSSAANCVLQVMATASAPEQTTREATGADVAVGVGEDGDETAIVNAEGGLTEAQLLEIFKQTSVFNVRSALAGNEVLMGGVADGDDYER